MPRINIEDELYDDPRFIELKVKLGEDRAIGQCVRLWKTAQQFWKQDRRLIPNLVFKDRKLSTFLIQFGLAEVREGGVYACGSEERFAWLISKCENGAKGGRKSKAKENVDMTKANDNRTQTDAQPSLNPQSQSRFQSQSQSLKQEKTKHVILPPSTADAAPSTQGSLIPEVMSKTAQNNAASALRGRIWQAYREAYQSRYRTEPVRNATVNAQIVQLSKRLGEEAPDIVTFYVQHNNGYYVGKCHPIGLCLADAEALRTQWARGKTITRNDVRAFEQHDAYRAQMERIEKGDL